MFVIMIMLEKQHKGNNNHHYKMSEISLPFGMNLLLDFLEDPPVLDSLMESLINLNISDGIPYLTPFSRRNNINF